MRRRARHGVYSGAGVLLGGYRVGTIPVYYPARYSPTEDGYALPLDVQPRSRHWRLLLGLPWGVLGRVLGGVSGGCSPVGASRQAPEEAAAPTARATREPGPSTNKGEIQGPIS